MPNYFFDTIRVLHNNIPRKALSLYMDMCDTKHHDTASKTTILPYALDAQAHDFLSAYFKVNIDTPDALALYIRLWQYEALLYTLQHAKQNTLAYKTILPDIAAQSLLCEARAIVDNSKNNTLSMHAIDLLCKALLQGIDCTFEQTIANNAEAFLAVRHDDVCGVINVETSGTSAVSKRIYCSEQDLQATRDFFSYGMQYLLRKGENRVALLMSGLRQGSVGHLVKDAMDILGVDCKVFGFPTDIDETFTALVAYHPTCIIGVPSHLVSLSYHKDAAKLAVCLDSVLLSGDSVTNRMCQNIAKLLSCEVFVHYGLTEIGLGGAVSCKQHVGLHMRQLDMYVEILDEHGQVVPKGAWGEVVMTTLSRHAMPLIRYRTGDEGRLLPTMCACGSVLQCLEVTGRIQQSTNLHTKRRVHITEYKDFLYAYPWLIDFEMCVLSDDTLLQGCLLLGLQYDLTTKAQDMQVLRKNFAQTFALSHMEKKCRQDIHLNNKADTGIFHFCMCSMKAYQAFIASTQKHSKQEALELQKNLHAPSPKKYIRHIHVPKMWDLLGNIFYNE